ncbi:MAG: hypothetical protein J1E32_08165 [Treponema sp.]|nr:hypothetical protein [Treponema sp.]
MKKIISALVIGAAAAGIATADLAITAGAKVSGLAFSWNTAKTGEKVPKHKSLFDLQGNDGIGENATLTAKGNIFTFYTKLGPTVESDNIAIKAGRLAASVGNFTFAAGFDRDGYKIAAVTSSMPGEEGADTNLTAYKLGSGFKGSPLYFSNNQWGFGIDPKTYFAQARYGLGLGESVKLNLAVSAMSPHGSTNSNESGKDKGNVVGDAGKRDFTTLGWGVFVNPVIGKIVSIDVFAKGFGNGNHVDGHNFLFGAYAKLLAVPMLKNAVFGGSAWISGSEGHTDLVEWNVDLDLDFALSDRFVLTFNNKLSANGTIEDFKIPGSPERKCGFGSAQSYVGQYMLWNVLGVNFKLNDTLSLAGTVGHTTAMGGDIKVKGTTIYVYPHVVVFAASKATVTGGFIATFDQLGMEGGRKMALLMNVPFTVKISL